MFLTDEDVFWGNAKCSLGLLTLVAFGEKFIRDHTASKHSQVQGCSSLGKRARGLAALCPVYVIFTFGVTSLEMSRRTCTFQETGNFSKTFDDRNTATQCLNLFTSIWNVILQTEVSVLIFLLYLILTSNSYQNSYKGNSRHFHSSILTIKTKNLNMTFFFCYETVFNNFTVLK